MIEDAVIEIPCHTRTHAFAWGRVRACYVDHVEGAKLGRLDMVQLHGTVTRIRANEWSIIKTLLAHLKARCGTHGFQNGVRGRCQLRRVE